MRYARTTRLWWLYLGSELAFAAAEVNVVLRYRLWPRWMVQPPLTQADKLMLIRLAGMEVRQAGGKGRRFLHLGGRRSPAGKPAMSPVR